MENHFYVYPNSKRCLALVDYGQETLMTAVCWQYLIKKEKKLDSPNFVFEQPISTSVTEISWNQAKEFILEYEWLGNMGTSKRCFGLFVNEKLASVVCFGPPVAPAHYKKLLGDDLSVYVVQLCRGASTFWAPKWAGSMLIAKSIRLLRGKAPILIILAYADPSAGEIGTVYQSSNAYYLGMTSSGGGKRYIINGHSYDPRKAFKKFGSRSKQHLLSIDPDFSTIPITPKHRYMIVSGTKVKRQEVLNMLSPVICQHPKR